jgi:hypothetical protein
MKKIKQLFIFLLVLGTIIIPTNAFASSDGTSFADITSHWAKKYIDFLDGRKIVTGISDLNFKPDQNITRAEFSAMLVKALDLNSTVTSNTYYQDVRTTDWYAGYVNSLAGLRLFNVYNDGFHADQEITREEIAAIIVRALDAKGVSSHIGKKMQSEVLSKFTDSDQIILGKEEVANVINAKIMNGIDDKTFAPRLSVTRAQASVILARFLTITDHVN